VALPLDLDGAPHPDLRYRLALCACHDPAFLYPPLPHITLKDRDILLACDADRCTSTVIIAQLSHARVTFKRFAQ